MQCSLMPSNMALDCFVASDLAEDLITLGMTRNSVAMSSLAPSRDSNAERHQTMAVMISLLQLLDRLQVNIRVIEK